MTSKKWSDEDLLSLGPDHACLTGDCAHWDDAECLGELISYTCDMADLASRQHGDIKRLREENTALRLGSQLGPIVGAQTIIEQQRQIERLRKALLCPTCHGTGRIINKILGITNQQCTACEAYRIRKEAGGEVSDE